MLALVVAADAEASAAKEAQALRDSLRLAPPAEGK
jgi:hypothetical protein